METLAIRALKQGGGEEQVDLCPVMIKPEQVCFE